MVIVLLLVLLCASTAEATTYYVRTDGSNSNLGTSNTAGGAWLTIDFSTNAANVAPGDTVRVQAGVYAEVVTPADSGTSGNPITYVADGAVTFCRLVITNQNYLRWIGFNIDTEAGGCVAGTIAVFLDGASNTGHEFWNNTISGVGNGSNNSGITSNSKDDRCHNCVIIGNTFVGLGSGGTGVGLRGNHNFFGYNEFDVPKPDVFIIDGTYSWWVNNYAHDASDLGGHSDIFQSNASTLGLQFNTFEANFVVGTGSLSDEHGILLQNQTPGTSCESSCGDLNENLFRFNVWHNISSGNSVDQATQGPITNTRFVHESYVNLMRNSASTAYSVLLNANGVGTINGYFHNGLFYQAWGASVTTNVKGFDAQQDATVTTADYNLAFDPDGNVTYTTPWTSQANELSNIDPALTSVATDDFTIGSGSGARDAAGPLTTTSGADTGTTFNVATGGGGFFRGPNTSIDVYSGALTKGDEIMVGTDCVTVASIATDAITVTASFTWGDAESVYLGCDTTPDVGAYPYKAGGYTLSATYTTTGGAINVTANDDSLVRFVVCYDDGVPYAVDNSSPFGCSTPSGTLTARVYPRYASTTLSVDATEASAATTPRGRALRRRGGH